ncbi:small G-protein Ras2 [Jimgerdemannia flammicorona]|uniref:Small G-protein Ras2 n=1 Tax=Jimgerdemannia flammicorona TaxID=994334 RepID=A0A433QKD6_9FUNG|nr:small G-protein Ras2 [Jimgerdemannia flammicorona]
MMLHNLVVLGDENVGKIELAMKLCPNQCIQPSTADLIREQAVVDDEPCVLEILVTAGLEQYTTVRDMWIRDGEGFLLVYSVTSRKTFESIRKYRDQILRIRSESDRPTPLMIVGNNCDRIVEREVSREEAFLLAREFDCDLIDTSHRTDVNVQRAFYEVVRMIRASQNGILWQPRWKEQDKERKTKRQRCSIQ